MDFSSFSIVTVAAFVLLALTLPLVWFWLRTPAAVWARIGCLTGTVQLNIIPLFGIYPSVSLVSALMSIRGLGSIRILLRQRWFVVMLLLFAWQLISAAWTEEKRTVLRYMIYQLPFIFLLVAIAQWSIHDRAAVLRTLRFMLIAVSLEAVLVIIFRLSPGAKSAFLFSTVAKLFISSNTLADILTAGVVIWDPGKSGGLLVFPNVAAAYLGVAAMITWQTSIAMQSRLLASIALLDWIAVFFTGSKAGAIVAFVVPALMFLRTIGQRRRFSDITMISACIAAAAIIALVPLAYEAYLRSGFTRATTDTFASREILWRFGAEQFGRHPWLGLGFGGWEAAIPRIGSVVGMPPHNAFIRLWADSGIIASLLGMLYVFEILWWSWGRSRVGDSSQQALAFGAFGALLWMFLQAQGENFGLFGQEHMKPLIAIVCGLMAADQYQVESSVAESRKLQWAAA